MCKFHRTVYTICAHSIDKRVQHCHPILDKTINTVRNIRRKPVPCLWAHARDAHLKVGWCPDCEHRIRTAYKGVHPRKIKVNDRHVITNFWAWRSSLTILGLMKLTTAAIPFEQLDQADELAYTVKDGCLSPMQLVYAHAEIAEHSPFCKWGELNEQSLFRNTTTFQGGEEYATVPALPPWYSSSGTPNLSYEQYAAWFSLYEFQPATIFPDPAFCSLPYREGAVTVEHAAVLVAKAMIATQYSYGQDLMRDTEGIRAQDNAERKAREREAEREAERQYEKDSAKGKLSRYVN